MQRDPWIQVFTRLGAVLGVILFLFGGLGTALRYGHSIGVAFAAALSDTPFSGELGSKLFIAFGSVLGGMAALMLCILFGALLGSALGAIIVRYVLAPLRSQERAKAEGEQP